MYQLLSADIMLFELNVDEGVGGTVTGGTEGGYFSKHMLCWGKKF
jgi:hypothetical protein